MFLQILEVIWGDWLKRDNNQAIRWTAMSGMNLFSAKVKAHDKSTCLKTWHDTSKPWGGMCFSLFSPIYTHKW